MADFRRRSAALFAVEEILNQASGIATINNVSSYDKIAGSFGHVGNATNPVQGSSRTWLRSKSSTSNRSAPHNDLTSHGPRCATVAAVCPPVASAWPLGWETSTLRRRHFECLGDFEVSTLPEPPGMPYFGGRVPGTRRFGARRQAST